MPRVGSRRRKSRTHVDTAEQEKHERGKVPRSFVLKRGTVGPGVADLVKDFRQVLAPLSAERLRESKSNKIKDFVGVAGHFGVTHLCVFTSTQMASYLKLARLPQGPTLTFKVASFTLMRDVVASQKRPVRLPDSYKTPAVIVLGGFSGGELPAEVLQLVSAQLKGTWPAVDIKNFQAKDCRRVALWLYNEDKNSFSFRHYHVVQRPANVTRSVRKVLRSHKVPNLGDKGDVADWVEAGGGASDSEADDDVQVNVPARRKEKGAGHAVALHLKELGPRLELELVKAEAGILEGEVLHHAYVAKTEEEQIAQQAAKAAKAKLREQRQKREEQAQRIKEQLQQRREANLSKRARGADDGDGDDEDEGPAKKKKFHPFGFARKKNAEKTVEFDVSDPRDKTARRQEKRAKGKGSKTEKAKPGKVQKKVKKR